MSTNSNRKSVTLADVARVASTSKTTASHALSGKGWVSPSTRETVIRVAAELGFQADPVARLLSNGQSEKTIGVYTLDLDLSARTRQLQMLQAALNDQGYSVPIYAYGYRGRDVLANQMKLMDTLIAQRPRAIVCNTSGVRPEVMARLRRFVDDGGTAVCYGYEDSEPVGCDRVVYDEGHSFGLGIDHLVGLGHREIGLFNVGARRPEGEMVRLAAAALATVGGLLREEWLFPNDGTRRYEEDGALLAQRFLSLRERPTAMMIANDYAAAAFVAAVAQAGVRIPEELSVVGHDDDAIAPYAVVPLTTVSVPVEEIGVGVLALLERRLLQNFGGPAQRIDVAGRLVVRMSSGPVAGAACPPVL